MDVKAETVDAVVNLLDARGLDLAGAVVIARALAALIDQSRRIVEERDPVKLDALRMSIERSVNEHAERTIDALGPRGT